MLNNNKTATLSPSKTTLAYLGGSAIQTIVDNPLTSYRQLVQQYAKSASGAMVDPKIASAEARAVFRASPIRASMSGVGPRLVGVGLKRVPKFVSLIGLSAGSEPGLLAATGASIISAPFINPIRMIEKQQRVDLKSSGKVKPVLEILRESAADRFRPLFRGTVPLMGHSLASATLGLVGQPRLQKRIERDLSWLGGTAANLLASAAVSPIYVAVTNPLTRLEVIMQTASIKGKPITVRAALGELAKDAKSFGARGVLRGNGVGLIKAIVSLSLFHEGRLFCMRILA
jgi:hypothetical protein